MLKMKHDKLGMPHVSLQCMTSIKFNLNSQKVYTTDHEVHLVIVFVNDLKSHFAVTLFTSSLFKNHLQRTMAYDKIKFAPYKELNALFWTLL